MMACPAIEKTTRRLRWMAAVLAGGMVLTSGAGLADDVHRHAVADTRQHIAHAAHRQVAAPDSNSGEYTRSVRSYAVPDITLVDQYGHPVRLREVLAAEEPVMMNFIFTSCSAICPVMSSIFSNVPRRLGASAGKLRMISISIDPENDTPQQLKAYAGKFGAGPRWQFLTGSVESVEAVQRAFGNFRDDKMSHEPLTFLRLAPGKPWVRIEGFADAEDLAREFQKVAQQ